MSDVEYYEKISEDLCGICYENIKNIKNTQIYCLKCPNLFHTHCMKNWKDKSAHHTKKCPYCSRLTLKYPKPYRGYCCFPFC